MVYEQLVLFDLAPYVVEQFTVEPQALDDEKVRSLVQDNFNQLEIDFHPQQFFIFSKEHDRLAA
jgi:hypothetical protein